MIKFFVFIILLLTLGSCSKSKLTSGNESLVLASNLYLSSKSDIRIFQVSSDSEPGLFVTQLVADSNNGKLQIPRSVYSGDYGDRSDSLKPQPLDLIARVSIVQPLESGDFYFEAPILGSEIEVTNVTTALSWVLRWGFAGKNLKISQNAFSNLIRSVELTCEDCRLKTNSEVVELIRSSTEIKGKLLSVLKKENPNLTDLSLFYLPPDSIFVSSTPNLGLHGLSEKESRELTSIELAITLLNPLKSSERILPVEWVRTFNGIDTVTTGLKFSYFFNYNDKGNHQIKPIFQSVNNLSTLVFSYTVVDENRNPFCNTPLELNIKSNRNNEINLNSSCRDLDIEDSIISFSLIAGPPGLTISSAGILRWTAEQMADGSSYTRNFTFLVSDSKLGYKEVPGVINITADRLPEIIFSSSFVFSEGVTTIESFDVVDLDGDPIVLRVSPVDVVSTGLPIGAGVLSNISRTGSSGSYNYQWSFMPSWMQAIGGNSTIRVKLSLYYDSQDPTLDGTVVLKSQIVTLNITNTDDPPVWDAQPNDLIVTEGVDMAMTFLGTATDPNPNATAITYSMELGSYEHCNWATTAGYVETASGNAYFNTPPPYHSEPTCTFQLVAVDANGLKSTSQSFVVSIIDMNRPITTLGTAPTILTGLEMQLLSMDLTTFFEDLDYVEEDPVEKAFTYQCLYDSDIDGTYETACSGALALAEPKIGFNSEILMGAWTPSAISAGTYHIRLAVTDHGGATASHDFTIQIDQAPAPMLLDISSDGITPTIQLLGTENSNLNFFVRARAATTDGIDNYAFKILTPICIVVGGGVCDLDFVAVPITNTGSGDTDLLYTVVPDFDDADIALPEDSRKYNLIFTLENIADPTVTTQTSVQITINNLNRLPTAIGVSSGSFGCTGSGANSSSDKFTVCVDASKDTKVGSAWTKNYTLTFSSVDEDNLNDVYSYSWIDGNPPASLTDDKWKFKLPNCIIPGNNNVIRQFQIELSDGRGGLIQRNIELKISKAGTIGSCML